MMENKNDLASTKTIRYFLEIARNHFSIYGYEKTSLEAIATEAKMTRGALYHHFKNKKDLFLAVFTEIQKEVGVLVEKAALTSEDPWDQLVLGSVGFIEAAIQDSNRRIFLVDSISVLDWDTWRNLDSENSASHLEEQLNFLKQRNMLVDVNPKIIAHLISGALNELVLYLANTQVMSQHDLYESVEYLLRGFKNNGNKA